MRVAQTAAAARFALRLEGPTATVCRLHAGRPVKECHWYDEHGLVLVTLCIRRAKVLHLPAARCRLEPEQQ